MPGTGVEPAQLAPHASETCVSTNFTIRAFLLIKGCKGKRLASKMQKRALFVYFCSNFLSLSWMMPDLHSIWLLLAGLGLFLFGVSTMEESLRILISRPFKKILYRFTRNAFSSVMTGVSITALLQSSTMVILLVMSFAGAGIIGLENGIGIILGANLGTTSTGWIMTVLGFNLNITQFVLPLMGVSGLVYVFIRQEKIKQLFRFLLGFSLLLLGLGYMKDSFSFIAETYDLSLLVNRSLVLFFLFGLALTSVIQSITAAMMIYLSSLAAGMIDFHQAMYLILGSSLGMSMVGIIGSLKGNVIKKRLALAQFIYNLFIISLTLLLVRYYKVLIIHYLHIADPLIAIVAFHSMFNLSGILVAAPFLKQFTRLIIRLIPDQSQQQSVYILHVNPKETLSSVQALHKEVLCFLDDSLAMNRRLLHVDQAHASYIEDYTRLKAYESEITIFYKKLFSSEMSEHEVERVNLLISVVRNATLSVKDIKDIRHNIDELANSGNDVKYKFFKDIQTLQTPFYNRIKACLDNTVFLTDMELIELKNMLKDIYMQVNSLISSEKENRFLDLPTLSNLFWNINNSNESMLRSLTLLWSYIKETDK